MKYLIPLLLLLSNAAKAQSANQAVRTNKEPIYFIDSVRVNKSTADSLTPSVIASVMMRADTAAFRQFHTRVFYILTKPFARRSYWKYFTTRSEAYAKAAPTLEKETRIQYILDDKPIGSNVESTLFQLNDTTLKEIRVIDKRDLRDRFHVMDKSYGVLLFRN